MGRICHALDQIEEARHYYTDALEIYREMENRVGEASTLVNKGILYHDALNQPQEALRYYTEALTIWREVGDAASVVMTLNYMGAVYNALGDYQKAKKSLTEVGRVLYEIGQAHQDSNRPQEAVHYYTNTESVKEIVFFAEG